MVPYVPPIIGVSANIQSIRELIAHVADTGLNVVITGESGVGKEIVAQNLYQNSPRVGKPFIKINCAALPEGLLESELFGYEPGAFTGAGRRKKGKFELAHSGVLLLDEIGDMSLPLQAKLLHVLQGGSFAPLGSEKEVSADTWVIASTNHELDKDIINGAFREDLYYRLNIIKIQITPLRTRPDDIPPLIDYYLKEYAEKFNRKDSFRLDNNMMQILSAYHWPGNVRELQNVLKRMLVLGNCEQIIEELQKNTCAVGDPASVTSHPDNTLDLISSFVPERMDLSNLSTLSLKKVKKKVLDKVEKEVITYVLQQTNWNRSKASSILKISYKTLLYKISDLGIAQANRNEGEES